MNEIFAPTYCPQRFYARETFDDHALRLVIRACLHLSENIAKNVIFLVSNFNDPLVTQMERYCPSIIVYTLKDYLFSMKYPTIQTSFKSLVDKLILEVDNINTTKQFNLNNTESDKLFITNVNHSFLYEPHMNSSQLSQKLNCGEIFQGTFNVFKYCPTEAEVELNNNTGEGITVILIIGKENANRALDGDVVAVKV